jgi:hypothetical protein
MRAARPWWSSPAVFSSWQAQRKTSDDEPTNPEAYRRREEEPPRRGPWPGTAYSPRPPPLLFSSPSKHSALKATARARPQAKARRGPHSSSISLPRRAPPVRFLDLPVSPISPSRLELPGRSNPSPPSFVLLGNLSVPSVHLL